MLLLKRLFELNVSTLYTLVFSLQILEHSRKNRTDISALSKTFGPLILENCSTKRAEVILAYLVSTCEFIFWLVSKSLIDTVPKHHPLSMPRGSIRLCNVPVASQVWLYCSCCVQHTDIIIIDFVMTYHTSVSPLLFCKPLYYLLNASLLFVLFFSAYSSGSCDFVQLSYVHTYVYALPKRH